MKVFKYDVSRSQKGEFVEDIPRPHSQGATIEGLVNLPRHNPRTTSWRVADSAGYNTSRPNLDYPFPVCFCVGQFSCGTEAPIWEWVILLPKSTPAKNGEACEANDWVSDAEYFADYNRDCNPDSF
jgi:hypothetical protein